MTGSSDFSRLHERSDPFFSETDQEHGAVQPENKIHWLTIVPADG
jgi:hypothetical protein